MRRLYHCGETRPHVADGGEGFHMLMIGSDTLKKQ